MDTDAPDHKLRRARGLQKTSGSIPIHVCACQEVHRWTGAMADGELERVWGTLPRQTPSRCLRFDEAHRSAAATRWVAGD